MYSISEKEMEKRITFIGIEEGNKKYANYKA